MVRQWYRHAHRVIIGKHSMHKFLQLPRLSNSLHNSAAQQQPLTATCAGSCSKDSPGGGHGPACVGVLTSCTICSIACSGSTNKLTACRLPAVRCLCQLVVDEVAGSSGPVWAACARHLCLWQHACAKRHAMGAAVCCGQSCWRPLPDVLHTPLSPRAANRMLGSPGGYAR